MTRYETLERSPTDELFGPRGRLTLFADDLRTPIGTVWSWKSSKSIPEWRRPAVLQAVRRLKIDVSPETLAYLATAN